MDTFHDKFAYIEHMVLLLAGAGAAVTTVLYFFKKLFGGIKLINKQIKTIDMYIPILLTIAEEFKPNHGSSLRDCMDRIEGELLRTQMKVRALLSTTHIAYLVLDEKQQGTWANCKYLDLVDLPLEHIMNKGWISSVHPEDREEVVSEIARTIKDKRDFRIIFRIMQNSGKEIKVLVTGNMTYKEPSNVFAGALLAITPYDETNELKLTCPYDYPCLDPK